MPTSPLKLVIRRLRAATERDGAGKADGELLTRFLSQRDNDALAALVHRHAPMVWGVCRRLLRSPHDAEDAFQATFLVLVRKAATVLPREMVGNWLYGVAHQTGVRLRAMAAKRGVREVQMTELPEPVVTEARGDDLLALLDQELSRLPEKYRVLIILCDLESKTRSAVARQLALPEGTVASRLARARGMLAKRLARHGLAVSGGSLASALSQTGASASVPTSVVSSTIKVLTMVAAGKTTATGAISVKVAALTEGVMKAMLLTKLQAVVAVVLLLGVVVAGASAFSLRTAAAQKDKTPIAEKPVAASAKQEPGKNEAEFAWGKEVDGLQLGLALVPADKIAYRPGEEIKFEVRVRNVSKGPITISYGLPESEPEITNAKGEMVYAAMPPIFDIIVIPTEKVLKPGETVALYQRKVAVEEVLEGKADPNTGVSTPTIRVRAGKYKIAFDEFVQRNLLLSTGIVEFEVKDKSADESPEKTQGFTAWGKEVGGLQAGLGYRPGEHRAYYPGETVRLLVRVRNVGKEEVKFHYFSEDCCENPPTVVNGDGKPVSFKGPTEGGLLRSIEASLAPGKEVELCKLNLQIRPVSEKGKDSPWTLYETGKYQIQYEQVGGNIVSPEVKANSILSKLATGKLELEVKEPEKPKENDAKAAKDDARTSLLDAIKALNSKASSDLIGKDETPITEQEVIAVIRAAERPNDSAVTDKLFDAFKKIAETKQLPAGAELEAVGGIYDPGTVFIYDVWWVRLRVPTETGSTYGFAIRERIIRSRTLQEELARLERKRPGKGEPAIVDGGRLQESINDLKARIEKMKTK